MCGRFTILATWSEVLKFSLPLSFSPPSEEIACSYNMAPSQACWHLRMEHGQVAAARARFGLIPLWQRAPEGYATFNARLESIESKPSYRGAWRQSQRCLIPASGYYEWQTLSGKKQAFYVRPSQAEVMFFAGIFEPEHHGQPESFSLVTKPARSDIAWLHDRMPIILNGDELEQWLRVDQVGAFELAMRASGSACRIDPVSSKVGNVRNNTPELIVPEPAARSDLFS